HGHSHYVHAARGDDRHRCPEKQCGWRIDLFCLVKELLCLELEDYLSRFRRKSRWTFKGNRCEWKGPKVSSGTRCLRALRSLSPKANWSSAGSGKTLKPGLCMVSAGHS